MPEFGHVGADPLLDSSSNAVGPSTLLGILGDYRTIGVSCDTDSQTILSKTEPWSPEADELITLVADTGKFLSGPGVIPVQGAMPLPQIIGHGQDTQYPQLDQVTSFDDRQLMTMDPPPPGEQGD